MTVEKHEPHVYADDIDVLALALALKGTKMGCV